jgi:hypothetical protein
MKKFETAPRAAGGIARIMNPVSRFGPRIMLAPQEDGTPTAEETAAADKAAADKAAADKAAADKAAADKAAADKAAADKKAEDDKKSKEDLVAERDKLLRETMERKNKIKDAEAEKERLAAELKRFEGIDPAVVAKLIEDNKTREMTEAEKKGEFDRVKKMMADDAAAREKTLKDQIDALTKSLSTKDKQIDTLTIGADFATSEFINKELVLSPEKTRILYGSHFELVDGKTVAYDKPAGQEGRTIMHGADGKPISFNDALRKIVEIDPDKDRLLRTKVKPGAASGTTTEGGQRKEKVEGELYGASRIAAALAKKQAAK